MTATTRITTPRPPAGAQTSPGTPSRRCRRARGCRAGSPAPAPRPACPSGASSTSSCARCSTPAPAAGCMIGIGAIIAIALTIMFFNKGGQHAFGEYLQATTMPMALILPGRRHPRRDVRVEPAHGPGHLRARAAPHAHRLGQAAVGAPRRRLRLRVWRSCSPPSRTRPRSPSAASAATGRWRARAPRRRRLRAARHRPGRRLRHALQEHAAAVVVFFVLPTAWSILASMVAWVGDAAVRARPEPDDEPTLRGLPDGCAVGPPRHVGRRLGRGPARSRHVAPHPRRGQLARRPSRRAEGFGTYAVCRSGAHGIRRRKPSQADLPVSSRAFPERRAARP